MEANQTPADYKLQGDIFYIPVKIKQIPYLRVKSLSQQKHKKME
ncbi:unnamed protein product [Paramecium octaurelia]|uniref:Uncharacterized protein n=1 Tax=Paramecium octaurelia TaxID=43137 RepID=A0A8S1W8T9_PAROT|nr:unnamed protein product [Paramecium octaurelia]